MTKPRNFLVFVLFILAIVLGSSKSSYAILVTQNCNAATLAATVATGAVGMVVTGSSVSSNSTNGAMSCGTYTNASNTYGIGPGVLLSSGNVSDYGAGPNTTPAKTTDYDVPATTAQEALLDPISGGSFDHFDVTQLNITFNMLPGFGNVFFNVVFGSEEYPEYVTSSFVDAFGLYLNGVNIASVGGSPVNIKHPSMVAMAGTELDGVLAPNGNPVLLFSGAVTPGSMGNTLTFIVADTSDEILDTTVYISQLGGTPPSQDEQPPPTGVPEPGSLFLVGAGLSSLVFARRRAALQRA